LKLHPDGLLIGGIDLGPNQVLAAIGDLTGELRGIAESATPKERSPQALFDTGVHVLKQACDNAGVDPTNLRAASISLPGLVNSSLGIARQSHNLGWRDVPVRAEMQKRLGLPVLVNNAILLNTLTESRFGAGKGRKDLIYVGAGSGIGAGVIWNGRLYRGPHDVALELGHTAMSPDGPICVCGNRGCLETMAAGSAIAAKATHLHNEGKLPSIERFYNGRAITAETVYNAALAGDVTCASLLAEAGQYLGLGIANLINLFGIESVVIGGVMTVAGDIVMKPLQRAVLEHVYSVLPDTVNIQASTLGRDAPLYGAIQLALEELVFSLE
jgi:glucokinase